MINAIRVSEDLLNGAGVEIYVFLLCQVLGRGSS